MNRYLVVLAFGCLVMRFSVEFRQREVIAKSMQNIQTPKRPYTKMPNT
jgi:hypothetical protein